MSPSPTWPELVAFVTTELALRQSTRLTPDTRLVEDLLVDGDDGDEFMEAFVQRFQVAWGDLDLSRHFAAEGLDLLAPLWRWLGLRQPAAPLEPITLGMLLLAAQAGQWDSATLQAQAMPDR